METSGYARWFERLLAELGFELWIGHPAEVTGAVVLSTKWRGAPAISDVQATPCTALWGPRAKAHFTSVPQPFLG
jgi:hypothetical protein